MRTLNLGARRSWGAQGQAEELLFHPAGTISISLMEKGCLFCLRLEVTVNGHRSQFRVMFKSFILFLFF